MHGKQINVKDIFNYRECVLSEWIAPAVSLIFIDKLVKYYGSDEQITQFIDQIDWYILPVMNPGKLLLVKTKIHTF